MPVFAPSSFGFSILPSVWSLGRSATPSGAPCLGRLSLSISDALRKPPHPASALRLVDVVRSSAASIYLLACTLPTILSVLVWWPPRLNSGILCLLDSFLVLRLAPVPLCLDCGIGFDAVGVACVLPLPEDGALILTPRRRLPLQLATNILERDATLALRTDADPSPRSDPAPVPPGLLLTPALPHPFTILPPPFSTIKAVPTSL